MRRPRVGRDVMAPVAGKLVVFPLVAAGAATVLGLTGTAAGVLILQLAMSAAVFAALIAIEHDHEADLVTTTVMVGTVLSVATLPVVISRHLIPGSRPGWKNRRWPVTEGRLWLTSSSGTAHAVPSQGGRICNDAYWHCWQCWPW